MEIITTYSEERMIRVLSSVGQNQSRRERFEDTLSQADKGWLSFGRLSERYGKDAPPKMLYDCAIKLLESSDGYVENVAWGILALPTVISHIAEDEQRFIKVCEKISDAIPNENNLPGANERNPLRYNFLWAEEVRLRLEKEADKLGNQVFLDNLRLTQKKIGVKHRGLLLESVGASDMDGTFIQNKYKILCNFNI